MEEKGTKIRIVSKHGYSYASMLSVEVIQDNLRISWRSVPEKLGVDMMHLKEIVQSSISDCCLHLLFQGQFELEMEFEDAETCSALLSCLDSLLSEAHLISREKDHIQHLLHDPLVREIQSLQTADFQTTINQEMLYQLVASLELKEARIVLQHLIGVRSIKSMRSSFLKWSNVTKEKNSRLMDSDKHRWRLHALSNQEVDLQAWYHAVFFNEIYRLRGPFWYKDAALPVYRSSYSTVVNALTPLEESALAHVLCSADTVYGDVAGQMFVVQAIVDPAQFHFFQHLASQGAMVTKYPRTGRPTKKLFRFSFVEGRIYLTWKGKLGNQGVDLGEVSHVSAGLSDEVLRRQVDEKVTFNSDYFLSLVCAGRSVDLCYETEGDRNAWVRLLDTLCSKEHGKLRGVEGITPVSCNSSGNISSSSGNGNENENENENGSNSNSSGGCETATTHSLNCSDSTLGGTETSIASKASSSSANSNSNSNSKAIVASPGKRTSSPSSSLEDPCSHMALSSQPAERAAAAAAAAACGSSSLFTRLPDYTDSAMEWSFLYSTIGPDIVPQHHIKSILTFDLDLDLNLDIDLDVQVEEKSYSNNSTSNSNSSSSSSNSNMSSNSTTSSSNSSSNSSSRRISDDSKQEHDSRTPSSTHATSKSRPPVKRKTSTTSTTSRP